MNEAFVGMNLAEVQRSAKEFDRAAGTLRSVGKAMDRILPTIPWSGRSVELFKQDWSASRKLLTDGAQTMSDLTKTIMRNWQEQSDKSESASGSGVRPPIGNSGGGWSGRERFESGLFIATTGDDLRSFIQDFHSLKKWKGLTGLFHHGSKLKIGPLAVIGTGWDTFNLFESVGAGNVDGGIRSGIDVGFGLGGMAFPHVGLAKGAWDVGYQIGKGIDWVFGEKLGGHQAFIDSVIIDRYGGQLSSSEADDLAHRYDGVSGFGHYLGDNASNTVNAAKSMWKRVFK